MPAINYNIVASTSQPLTVGELRHFLKAYADDALVIAGDTHHVYFAQIDFPPSHCTDSEGREAVCLQAGRPTSAKITENVIFRNMRFLAPSD